MVRAEHFTVAILQARMSSSRLPGKVMMPINGAPMIYRQIERIKQATTINLLQFWKDLSNTHPNIAACAKAILAIPEFNPVESDVFNEEFNC